MNRTATRFLAAALLLGPIPALADDEKGATLPGVRVGAERFEKTLWFEAKDPFHANHIRVQAADAADGAIYIAGPCGLAKLTMDGKVREERDWCNRSNYDDFDGAYVLATGPDSLGLLLHGERMELRGLETGEVRWRMPKTGYQMAGVSNFAFGDLDADGAEEIVLEDAEIGLQVFNADGSKRWRASPAKDLFSLMVADFDGDGREEVAVSSGTRWWFYGDDGRNPRVLPQKATDPRRMYHAIDAYPGVDDRAHAARFDGTATNFGAFSGGQARNLEVVDMTTGNVVFRRAALRGDLFITLVFRSRDDAPPVLATVGSAVHTPTRGLIRMLLGGPEDEEAGKELYEDTFTSTPVYLLEGERILYHEVLAEAADDVARLPQPDGTDALLVGTRGRVWKYTRKPAAEDAN